MASGQVILSDSPSCWWRFQSRSWLSEVVLKNAVPKLIVKGAMSSKGSVILQARPEEASKQAALSEQQAMPARVAISTAQANAGAASVTASAASSTANCEDPAAMAQNFMQLASSFEALASSLAPGSCGSDDGGSEGGGSEGRGVADGAVAWPQPCSPVPRPPLVPPPGWHRRAASAAAAMGSLKRHRGELEEEAAPVVDEEHVEEIYDPVDDDGYDRLEEEIVAEAPAEAEGDGTLRRGRRVVFSPPWNRQRRGDGSR